MKTIDQLKNEYSIVKEDLEKLKNSTLSKKDDQAEILKQEAKKIEDDMQKEIEKLKKSKEKADIDKAEEAEKFLNETKIDIQNLYNDILDIATPRNTPTTATTPTTQTSKWNIFSKSWNWIKDQWWDIRKKSKWEWETGKNILRTVWFAATWVWAIALGYKWLKKLFWRWKKKPKEASRDEELLKESATRLFKHLSEAEKKSK